MNDYLAYSNNINSFFYENQISCIHKKLNENTNLSPNELHLIRNIVDSAIGYEEGIYIPCEIMKSNEAYNTILELVRNETDKSVKQYGDRIYREIGKASMGDYSEISTIKKLVNRLKRRGVNKGIIAYEKGSIENEYFCFK